MCHQHRITKNQQLNSNLNLVARELAKVRDKGLPEEEFNALVAQKKLELQKLFAAYARADTDILMGQRMRSLQMRSSISRRSNIRNCVRISLTA
ncbi:hypothetical protein ACLK1Z_20165 [Escherichia coli]